MYKRQLQGLADTTVIPANISSNISSTAAFTVLIYANSTLFVGNSTANETVATKVMSVKISNVQDGSELEAPVQFFFVKSDTNATEFQCVYWDFDSAAWATDGCEYVPELSNETYAVCSCTHLVCFVFRTA